MSSGDQEAAAILAQFVLAADGAVLGIALAYIALRSFFRLSRASSALRRISQAPSVRVADLRSLLSSSSESDFSENFHDSDAEKLVVVRGVVCPKSTGDGNWMSWRPNVLLTSDSGEKGVILQRTQTCIYHEWRGFFGWTSELRALFMRSLKDEKSKSLRMVPFILVDTGQSDHLVVNMDGSDHPLPLTKSYHHFHPINATPFSILQAIIGHQFPVGLLDEDKILPVGKDISAAGICYLKNGFLEIRSSKDVPYFLSDMTKEQMVVELAFKTKMLLWTGILVGSVSLGILSYAAMRRWKAWHERRASSGRSSSSEESNDSVVDGEEERIGDGELCVICLLRRRRSVFIPCGHLVCCYSCALSVEREFNPKCPVCRQRIQNAVRIYDS